jgi:hypothetical protein
MNVTSARFTSMCRGRSWWSTVVSVWLSAGTVVMSISPCPVTDTALLDR